MDDLQALTQLFLQWGHLPSFTFSELFFIGHLVSWLFRGSYFCCSCSFCSRIMICAGSVHHLLLLLLLELLLLILLLSTLLLRGCQTRHIIRWRRRSLVPRLVGSLHFLE